MTKIDQELNELLAKRLLADVAAVTTMQNHFEGVRVVSGSYFGAGAQMGASGVVRNHHHDDF